MSRDVADSVNSTFRLTRRRLLLLGSCSGSRQPNSTTFASQSRQWHALILDYCARQRLFRFDLSESALVRGSYELPNGNTETELWENKRIKSR